MIAHHKNNMMRRMPAMPPLNASRRRILLGALLAPALIPACGKTPSPLRVGTNIWIGYESLYVAENRGLLARQAIRLITMRNASEVQQALHAGMLEAAAMSLDEALNLVEEGLDLRVVLVMGVSHGADVVLGLSAKGAITKEMVASMAPNPIIFAMANPDPEITPEDVASVRLMPCPGPKGVTFYCGDGSGSGSGQEPGWRVLGADDSMIFVYQATLWRRSAYAAFMGAVIAEVDREFGPLTSKQKVDVQIRMNVAEVELGQNILRQGNGMHLAWEREGTQPNAVYLCPWPYRPTAVVNGKLQGWAAQLAEREGIALWASV
jgi:hypothetical protein